MILFKKTHSLKHTTSVPNTTSRESSLMSYSISNLEQSGLDYDNFIMYGMSASNTHKLQTAQNSLTRVVLPSLRHLSVTERLSYLHWLPVAGRIKFKLCLLMHLIHTGRAPQYLVDTVQSVTTSSRRHLRSSETTDYVKRTTRTKFGERGFSHSGPAAWNSLPSHLRTVIDTNVFKHHLKVYLFTESFA